MSVVVQKIWSDRLLCCLDVIYLARHTREVQELGSDAVFTNTCFPRKLYANLATQYVHTSYLEFQSYVYFMVEFGPIQHATLPPRHESFFPRVLIGNNFLNLFSILDAYMYLIFLGKNTSQFWQKWQSGGIPPPPQSMHIFSSHLLIMRHHNRQQKYQNFMFDPRTAPGFKFCSQPLPDPWIF